MYLPGFLQTGQNTTGWIWFVILVVLLLLFFVWWFNRRRAEQPPAPVAEPVQVQKESSPDDLVKLEGIGPKVARVLNEAGITTFEALAHANPADLQKTLNAAGLQMMDPEGWIEQAALAARGEWDELEKLQDQLKGGRKK